MSPEFTEKVYNNSQSQSEDEELVGVTVSRSFIARREILEDNISDLIEHSETPL